MKSRALVVLRWAFFLLAGAGMILLAWAAWIADVTGSFRPPVRIGNTPEVLAALPSRGPGDSVRFAVLSDVEEGVETFREALRRFAERRPDFVVLNGDMAQRPTLQGFRYFLWQFRDAAWPGPYFCGAGNHDIADGNDLALFRARFGDERFAFRLGACQFLILNNNGTREGTLSGSDYRWLESAAASPGPGPEIRHRFLFLHVPPLDAPQDVDRVQPRAAFQRLYDLAPRLKIRRVFCGNLHAYRRIEIGGTVYVVCGGGGADRQSPESVPHYVEVVVEGDRVADETIPLPEIHSPVEAIDRFACLYVGPWLARHPVAGIALGVAALAALAGPPAAALRARARRRAAGRGTEALQSPPAS